jgi:exodeoxyribonuclease VII large subunit
VKDCFGKTPKPTRETRAQPRLPPFDDSTQFLLQFLQTPWLINLQMQQQTDFFGSATKVFTVAELTRAIRGTLETRFGSVWVQGEISNYKQHPSGHQYFTLKDSRAQIACVIFRNAPLSIRQPLADGAQVQVYGSISVFEARGQYQLSVEIVQPRGLGLLQAKFEALKRKLEAEGLFDPARKKPLPRFPKRIGIVTSPSGAAIRDILNILRRRARGIEILINPVRVQGSGAAPEIASAINELSNPSTIWPPLDLIVIARGGGSIEDLWEFNEEIVARAIVAALVPIVSAVGHEVDYTIADFVADLRAPTPSAAAELIVPAAIELDRRVNELTLCLHRCWQSFIAREQTRLRLFSERAVSRELLRRMQEGKQTLDWKREMLQRNAIGFLGNWRGRLSENAAALRKHDPSREIILRRNRFAEITRRLVTCPPQLVDKMQERFERLEKILGVLGPDATMSRGYSMTMDEKGNLIRSVSQVNHGDKIRTRLMDGEIESAVT